MTMLLTALEELVEIYTVLPCPLALSGHGCLSSHNGTSDYT